MEIDHVILAVDDLAAAAREFEARHGLASVEGGRHPDWGTANRIVPLGGSYLELIAVVEPQSAARSAFGQWVARSATPFGHPLGWAVRTSELDALAQRLGLSPQRGSRLARGGEILSWRSAGVAEAAAEPPLPFFIEWEAGTPFPGTLPVRHPAGEVRLAEIHLSGDPARLSAWLGEHRMPVVVESGDPALRGVVLHGSQGEMAIMGPLISAHHLTQPEAPN